MSGNNGECNACPDTPSTPKPETGYGFTWNSGLGRCVPVGGARMTYETYESTHGGSAGSYVDLDTRYPETAPAEAQEDTPRGAVLRQAWELTHGPRFEDYGDPKECLDSIARAWSLVLGIPVSARQVAQCMVMMKVVRDVNSHKVDNMADAAAYAAIAVEVGG